MTNFEPIEWENGYGKIFYQPRCDEEHYFYTYDSITGRAKAWLSTNPLYRVDPILYRSKKLAIAIAKRYHKRMLKKEMKKVKKVT